MTALGFDAPGWAQHKDFKTRQGIDLEKRVFICYGANAQIVRRLLLERGWVENVEPKSRAFDLKWTIRPSRVDGLVGCMGRSQIVNHFRGAGQLDLKAAIASNLGACAACCEKIFPRQYDLRKAVALRAFLQDYMLTAAHAADLREQQQGAMSFADVESAVVGEAQALNQEVDDSEDDNPREEDDDERDEEDDDDDGEQGSASPPSFSSTSPAQVPLARNRSSRRLRGRIPSITSVAGEDASDAEILAAARAAAATPPPLPPPVPKDEWRIRRQLLRGHAAAVVRKAINSGRKLGARVSEISADAPLVRCCHDLEALTGRSRCLPSWLEPRFGYFVDRYDAEVRQSYSSPMAVAAAAGGSARETESSVGVQCPRCATAGFPSSRNSSLPPSRSCAESAVAVPTVTAPQSTPSDDENAVNDRNFSTASESAASESQTQTSPIGVEPPPKAARFPRVHSQSIYDDASAHGSQHAAFDGAANAWILKAQHLSRGRAISVYTDLRALLEEAGLKHVHKRQTWNCVAQKYLERPLTLSGHKVDLRLWVLLTSWYPCVAWVFKEPYFRIASAPLAFDSHSKRRRLPDQAHLTNRTRHDEDNRITLEDLFGRLAADEHGPNSIEEIRTVYLSRTWPQMLDGVRAALLATQAAATAESEDYRSRTRFRLDGPRTFELFGFDFALDYEMRPWLLEANCSPDMLKDASDDLQAWAAEAVDGLLGIVLNSHEGKFRYRPSQCRPADKVGQSACDAGDSTAQSGANVPRGASVEEDMCSEEGGMPPLEPRPLLQRAPGEEHASKHGSCYGSRISQIPDALVRGMKVEGSGGWLLILNEAETAPKANAERSRALTDLRQSWTTRLASSCVGPQASAGHSQVLRELLLPLDETFSSGANLDGDSLLTASSTSRLRPSPSSGVLLARRSVKSPTRRGSGDTQYEDKQIHRSKSEGPKAWAQVSRALTRLPPIATVPNLPSTSARGR